MRLYYSPNSPYARKARIIIHELGLSARVECTAIQLPADAAFRAVNPLGKIPALVLDDGSAIYDSPVICEYLDTLGQGKFFPRATLFKEAQGRWRALTLQALGDGLADAVVRRNQEMRLAEDKQSTDVIRRQTAAIKPFERGQAPEIRVDAAHVVVGARADRDRLVDRIDSGERH